MIDMPISSHKPESLCMATAETRVDTPLLESDHSVDVALVGACMKLRDRLEFKAQGNS